MGKAGTDHRYSEGTGIGGKPPLPAWTVQELDYPIIGSFHKHPANERVKLISVSTSSVATGVSTGSMADNGYVTSLIPAQDFGYSWISNLYAQGVGSLTSAPTLLSLKTIKGMEDQRWTNVTPAQMISKIVTDPTLNMEYYPIVVGYAPSSGRQRITNTLGYLEHSSHIFPTISDVACCADAVPTMSVTTPPYSTSYTEGDNNYSFAVPSKTYTSDFTVKIVQNINPDDGSQLDAGTFLYGEGWTTSSDTSECCDEDTSLWTISIWGSTKTSGGSFVEEPEGILVTSYGEEHPNFGEILSYGSSSDKVVISESPGGLGDNVNGIVYIRLTIADCEGRTESVLITLENAIWEYS